jgi:hypothetical protein
MVLRKEKKETNNTFSAEEIPSAPGGPTSLPPSQSPLSLRGGTEGLIAGNTWPEYQAHVVTLKQPVVVGKHTDA